ATSSASPSTATPSTARQPAASPPRRWSRWSGPRPAVTPHPPPPPAPSNPTPPSPRGELRSGAPYPSMAGQKRTGSTAHAIAALAKRQHGVVARDQLRRLGLRNGAIDDRIASGYLQPLFHATFAVGHGAITRQGRMFAAVLACEQTTVLSHGSAA